MSNFNPKLQDATEKELMNIVNESDPTHASLASDELTRQSIKKLNETIIKGAEQSEKSARTDEKLTIAMYAVAAIQLVVSVIQLLISFVYSDDLRVKIYGVVMVFVIIVFMYFIHQKMFKSDNKYN